MNAPGPTRLGKYEIVQTLGAGAMGVVYLAYDAAIDRQVAVKTIRKDMLGGERAAKAAARFRQEAMAAGRLSHPGIVAVYDYGEDESVAYIVMEYAPGEDLARLRETRAFGLPEIGVIMAQLLDALEYAHGAGIVHRDIKPANLLMSGRLKITDFGIARIARSNLTQTGATMGTPAYMAPEQYMGLRVDQRVDLFASGVLFYELLTGVKPFDGESIEELAYKVCHVEPPAPTSLVPHLPWGVDAVVRKALAKDREARFATAAEMARAIGDALAGRGSGVTPVADRAAPVAAGGSPTGWEADTLLALENVLAPAVGSVSGALVRRSTARSSDPEQLVRMMTETITGDEARATIAGRLRTVLGNRAPAPGPASLTTSTPPAATAVTADAIARITTTLATYVGPIAKVMVRKTAADATTYAELCRKLSARLGTEEERARFLRDVGVK